VVVFQFIFLHESLDFGVGFPVFAAVFVAADMDILVFEKSGHFLKKFIHKFVGKFLGGINGGIEDSPVAFDFGGGCTTGELGISKYPGTSVGGHIEFRDDANAAVGGIGDNFFNLGLGIIEAVG